MTPFMTHARSFNVIARSEATKQSTVTVIYAVGCFAEPVIRRRFAPPDGSQ
jgi:hypothetical protein